jgi:serine/threonine-protein kinase
MAFGAAPYGSWGLPVNASERSERIKEIVEAVLLRDVVDRAPFLEAACGGDETLRADVERVLATRKGAGCAESLTAVARTLDASTQTVDRQPEQPLLTISHYRILGSLGRGGMGVVFHAFDTVLRRSVALKVLRDQPARKFERSTRFFREARAASALNHPNVAQVYEIGEADGVLFIVMEHIEGRTLRAKIDEGPLEYHHILEIGTQVADALAEAHSHGIVHRDVKPANIMLNTRGQVKVLDFGLAKVFLEDQTEAVDLGNESMSVPGTLLGTVCYMSPEQVLGKPVDQRTDVFSLGTVLYEMAARRRPFDGTTTTETMDRILHHQPPLASQFNGAVAAAFEQVIFKCLDKNRDRRYHTAGEVAEDLRRLTFADSNSFSGPMQFRRRWIMTVASAACGSLLGAIAIYRAVPWKKKIDSLAVLPFANIAGNPELEYLTDGITESLINTFSQVPQLRVIARPTVFTYKGKRMLARQIGNALRVDAILSGRVRQRGSTLNMQAELIDTADESQLWGGQFDGTISDVPALRRAVEMQILEILRRRLGMAEANQPLQRATENAEAYNLYLRGRHAFYRFTVPEFKRAINLFNEAAKVDPNYALAWTGIADAYSGLSGIHLPPQDAMPRAKAAAAKALEIDSALADAHVSAGIVSGWYEFDWPQAERELRLAISLNPNHAAARLWLGWVLTLTGRFESGIAESKGAQQLDPLSSFIDTGLAQQFYLSRQYDLALAPLRRIVDLDPDFWAGRINLGLVYLSKGMYREAISELEVARRLDSRQPQSLAYLGCAYSRSGRLEDARMLLLRLQELLKERYISGYLLAVVYASLKAKNTALDWLEKAYEERDDMLNLLGVDPLLDGLRDDGRFVAVLRRVGLAPPMQVMSSPG